MLSLVEKDYIRQGVDQGFRSDGRSCIDYRQPRLELGVIPQADGSARCRLGDGTDVLANVKAVIAEADLEEGGGQGKILCSVDWYVRPSCPPPS